MQTQLDAISTLLVVEDSDEDFEALSRIFRKFGVEGNVRRCINGEECLEILGLAQHMTVEGKGPFPGMILLDLNLPGMHGCDALKLIKSDPVLKVIPVTVFSTSSSPRDVTRCYVCGANSYVLKPLDYDDLIETMRTLTDFWLRVAVLPSITV